MHSFVLQDITTSARNMSGVSDEDMADTTTTTTDGTPSPPQTPHPSSTFPPQTHAQLTSSLLNQHHQQQQQQQQGSLPPSTHASAHSPTHPGPNHVRQVGPPLTPGEASTRFERVLQILAY